MAEQNMIEQAMSGMVKGFFAEMSARDEAHEKMRKEIENVSNARAAECKSLTQLDEENRREIYRLQQKNMYLNMRLEAAENKVREMLGWIIEENESKAIEIIGERGHVNVDLQDMMVEEYCSVMDGLTPVGYWEEHEEEDEDE